MYSDAASEAPLYLVPNSEGTGKRLVRRPHPPPTSAPMPDDFDALTVTRATTYLDAGDTHHVGRRRVSVDGRRRVENALGLGAGSVKGKDRERAGQRSVDLTDGPRSPLQRSFSGPSSPPQTNASRITPPSPQKPGINGKTPNANAAAAASPPELSRAVESVLASCQPSLLHIAPVLEELGVRRNEHLHALARMSDETRDREVKEEALRKGVTVVEWAILIDKLQSL
ncbi:hypothetical protein FA95DRAFT_276332 [Auriscalpium vulgare]|uniref:Uncharacterized protein n=1 Tax=Auriscalpium vulgare TaxID=40419 RepID=A0ACB8S6B7_9AGAM|nr:hypothetical protein FA95DRAFT_276332 [Auriscalpium vulgare]